MLPDTSKPVLMIDDDPSHLKIYGWILERGGFHALSILATPERLSLPADQQVKVVIMGYRLGDFLRAVDVAQQVRASYPGAPIIVLSDLVGMPTDIAPYAETFVRKGDPEELLKKVSHYLGA
jgi:DNA-binding NtrC family response regulator